MLWRVALFPSFHFRIAARTAGWNELCVLVFTPVTLLGFVKVCPRRSRGPGAPHTRSGRPQRLVSLSWPRAGRASERIPPPPSAEAASPRSEL